MNIKDFEGRVILSTVVAIVVGRATTLDFAHFSTKVTIGDVDD
ncbi:hypothetical protein SPD48_03920 [Pseudogracilibacillus sp. SE30717A]